MKRTRHMTAFAALTLALWVAALPQTVQAQAQITLPKLGDETAPTGRFIVTPPGTFKPPGEKAATLPAPPAVPAPAPALAPPSFPVGRADSGLAKAEYFLIKGLYAEALEPLDDVLTRHPENTDAYTYRGLAFEGLGEDKAAEDNFRKALELDAGHLGANAALGRLLARTGNIGRAVEQLAVIRMICGASDCAEKTALETAINQAKNTQEKTDKGATTRP